MPTRRQERARLLKPSLDDETVKTDTEGMLETAAEMKRAEARLFGDLGECQRTIEMGVDIVFDPPDPLVRKFPRDRKLGVRARNRTHRLNGNRPVERVDHEVVDEVAVDFLEKEPHK